MDLIGENAASRRFAPIQTPKQVLQHEMGHFGQAPLQSTGNEALQNALYYEREARASATSASRATDAADKAALADHARANIQAAQGFLNP
jgi:hypothetical protein